MSVGFEHVAVVCVLGMSGLEMMLWRESGAHRQLHVPIQHVQNLHVQIQHVVLHVFYRHLRSVVLKLGPDGLAAWPGVAGGVALRPHGPRG